MTAVAHLISPGPVGGAESVVRALASGRARRGLPTYVFGVVGDGSAASPFFDALREAGVGVVEMRHQGRRYDRDARAVRALVDRFGISVLHTHVYRSDFVGYLAARQAGIPVVSTFHGECGGSLMNRLYEWSVKRLFRRFDAVIAVSEHNRRLMLASGSNGRNLVVVPNGVVPSQLVARDEARRRLGVPLSGARIVGWLGRFSAEKGPDQFLTALAKASLDRTVAVMIGEGPDHSAIMEQAKNLGVQVSFPGMIPDAPRLLGGLDLLVSSSRAEGLPMVLLEAFGARVPLAAFTVGGIPQLLTEDTGWPVAPGDIEGLASAMSAALSASARAAAKAHAAEALVARQFGLERWLDSVEAVYDRLLTRSARGAHRPAA